MRKLITLLCLCTIYMSGYSQEQLGLRLDKFSGVNSLTLNPANGAHFALGWDLNLVGAGIFLENNIAFATPTNIPHLLENSNDIGFAPDLEGNPTQSIIADFRNDNKLRSFSIYTEVLGPSLMINIAKTHAIGYQSKLRASFGTFDMDNDLGYYQYQDIDLDKPLELEAFSVSGMVWQEHALSYSYAQETFNGKVSFGASLKLMKAYESFFVDVAEPILATKVQNDSLYISEFDVSLGFTTASLEQQGFANEFTGQGIGLDIGATFLIDENDGDYFAKFGVALLDLGKVNFDTQTEKYALKNTTPTSFSANDFNGVNSQEEAFTALSLAINGDSTSAKQPAGYSIWAPTALSLQGDIQFQKNLYVAAALIQRIPFSGKAVKRNNTLAVYPRFENRWFSLGFPVVVNNWQDFRLGTSMRIGFLTVGSDNLGSFVGRGSLTGTDVYLAIKANPFTLNVFGGGKGSRKASKSVKCYKF